MPMASGTTIKQAIVTELLAMKNDKGEPAFVKHDSNGKVVPNALPEPIDQIAEGIANGVSNALSVWMVSQPVTVPVASTPSVAIGTML